MQSFLVIIKIFQHKLDVAKHLFLKWYPHSFKGQFRTWVNYMSLITFNNYLPLFTYLLLLILGIKVTVIFKHMP